MSAMPMRKTTTEYVIADARLPRGCIDGLLRAGFELIALPADSALSGPVSGHPDMLIFLCDRVICRREYYDTAHAELDRIALLSGLSLELSDEPLSSVYPGDVLFNALCIGGRLFGRLDSLSRHVLDYADRAGLTAVNTRQGYAKCSVCPVSDTAAITADRGMARSLTDCGIDVLIIEPGHVDLPGLDRGFIGGASGVFRDRVYFCGSLDTHPDGQSIVDFCKKHGKAAVSLSNEPLFDAGSLFFL